MIALIWTLLVTLLTLIGYRSFRCYAIKRKLFWLKHIPAWPVLGNALELAGDSKGILGRISDMFNKHGNLLFVDFVGKPNIFSIDYDFNEFILTSNSILNKSTDYRFIRNWLGTGLLTSDGPKWKVRRRIMTPTFHFSILEQFVEVFEKNGNIMIDRMKKEIGNDSFDVYPYITLCALDIICESAMGVPVNAQLNENSEYVRNVKQMLKIGALRSTSILKNNDLTYLLTPDHWREKRAVKHLHAVTNSVIDARRERMEKLGREKEEEVDELGRKKRLAFLDVLLRSTQDGKPLSREDIREEVDTFMFEGHDTTASAMSFATYLLATHPKVQKKAVEEQKELFGDDFHRAANYKDLQNMKYLECVIKESLRMYPSVPMYGRHTNEDVFYKGNLIPKGTDIIIYDYGVLRDPENFPDPEKFLPDRFEKIDGKRPYNYIPFSAGSRNCIGQKFAMLEMKCTLSKILRNFEISTSIPEHTMVLVSEAVLKSANGVRVRVTNRKL